MDVFIRQVIDVLIFFSVLGVLIIVHELGHFIAAKRCGMKVDVFSIGFGPVLLQLKCKDFDFRVCAVPFGGYVKLSGFSKDEYNNQPGAYLSKSIGLRSLVVSSGVVFNYFLAWLLFCLVFLSGMAGFSIPANRSEVGGLKEGFPAEFSGIEVKDVIVEIDGVSVETWEEMALSIQATTKKNLPLVVLREGRRLSFSIPVARKELEDTSGNKKNIALIGITPVMEQDSYSFFEAIGKATQHLSSLTSMYVKALGNMIIGKRSLREVTGLVGIFVMTKQQVKQGLLSLIHFVAVLSMCLSIMNLLPLPVLDGGHLVFLLVEKIRGRSLSIRTEEIITKIGISFLVIVMLLVVYNDVIRFGPKLLGK